MPGAVELGIGLAFLLALIGIAGWIYKSGRNSSEKARLKDEVENHEEFEKRGEEWDSRGGLFGSIKRKLSKR